MLQLQLYIEGQEVEMFKDESITLTQNITDVKRIDAVLTDYSRSFTVPASKNNNKIFKHLFKPLLTLKEQRKMIQARKKEFQKKRNTNNFTLDQ